MPNLFHKVSTQSALDQFQKFPVSIPNREGVFCNPIEFSTEYASGKVLEAHHGLTLPKKAHDGDAGYDIRTPFAFTLYPGQWITVPLFITCELKSGRYLTITPRSGHGFNFLRVANIFPVIDQNFYPKPIAVKLRNESEDYVFEFDQYNRICQAVICFHDTLDDDSLPIYGSREGGLGSSGDS